MNAPRDIKDRIAKRLLRHPRMVRDMLAFVPAEWLADVRLDSLRELPAEFVSARGSGASATCCGWRTATTGGGSC